MDFRQTSPSACGNSVSFNSWSAVVAVMTIRPLAESAARNPPDAEVVSQNTCSRQVIPANSFASSSSRRSGPGRCRKVCPPRSFACPRTITQQPALRRDPGAKRGGLGGDSFARRGAGLDARLAGRAEENAHSVFGKTERASQPLAVSASQLEKARGVVVVAGEAHDDQGAIAPMRFDVCRWDLLRLGEYNSGNKHKKEQGNTRPATLRNAIRRRHVHGTSRVFTFFVPILARVSLLVEPDELHILSHTRDPAPLEGEIVHSMNGRQDTVDINIKFRPRR